MKLLLNAGAGLGMGLLNTGLGMNLPAMLGMCILSAILIELLYKEGA